MTNANIDDMKVDKLRKELRKKGLRADGKKAVLQDRLRAARAAKAAEAEAAAVTRAEAAAAEAARAEVEAAAAAEAADHGARYAGRPDPPGRRNDEGAGANDGTTSAAAAAAAKHAAVAEEKDEKAEGDDEEMDGTIGGGKGAAVGNLPDGVGVEEAAAGAVVLVGSEGRGLGTEAEGPSKAPAAAAKRSNDDDGVEELDCRIGDLSLAKKGGTEEEDGATNAAAEFAKAEEEKKKDEEEEEEQHQQQQLERRWFHHYTKDTQLGQGSFGKVFVVLRKDTQVPAAIKEVKITDPQTWKLCFRELQTLIMAKGHPNVVQVEDYFTTASHDEIQIVFELSSYGDLKSYIQSLEGECLPEATAQAVVQQVGRAVKYLHSLQIVSCFVLHVGRSCSCDLILINFFKLFRQTNLFIVGASGSEAGKCSGLFLESAIFEGDRLWTRQGLRRRREWCQPHGRRHPTLLRARTVHRQLRPSRRCLCIGHHDCPCSIQAGPQG